MSPPPRDPLEITRRFQLLERLGAGAMGEVFAALDPDTGQRVAVKLLHPELAEDAGTVHRFREEAAITLAIDHPGSIPVYGIGSAADGRPFYVMKQVRGRPLSALLAERGRHVTDLHWRRRLIALFREVCAVVAYAHDRGIIHRDLKPDNILVDEQDGVTVIDWGLAKRTGASRDGVARTVLGDVLGSPGYMAPEQAAGGAAEAGPPADVFALGAILYEILSGDRPFPGATPRESMLAAIHRDPPPLDQGRFWLSVPRSLIAVCRKALAKESGSRYANAGELARDLAELGRGRPAAAAPPSLFERTRWAARRRPITFAAGAMVAAGIALALAFALVQHHLDQLALQSTLRQIERQDLATLELAGRLRALNRRGRVAAAPLELRQIELERAGIETRRLLYQLDSIHRLRSLDDLRFSRRDPRLPDLMKTRVFDAVRSALDLGEPAFAKALAIGLAEDGLGGPMSATDRRRLQYLIAEADRAIAAELAEEPLPQPPLPRSPQ